MGADEASSSLKGTWKLHRRAWWKRKRFWILLLLLAASVLLSYWLISFLGDPAKPE